MGFGPVTRFTVEAVDVVSPGACSITDAKPVSNTKFKVTGFNPEVNFDGSPLTDLKGRACVSALVVGGVDPTADLGMAEILALPGTSQVKTSLDNTAVGAAYEDFPEVLQVGAMHVICVAAADHELQ